MILSKSESILSRVNKVRDNLVEDLRKVKDDIVSKVDENDKYFTEQLEILQGALERSRHLLGESIDKVKDSIKVQSEKLREESKDIFKKCKKEQLRVRYEIEEKYDERISKIKSVSAAFFNRYDADLKSVETKVESTSKAQEEWVKKIVAPQELNQARLFAIETRMKESEESRISDFNFTKDTVRRLIYAIE